MRRVNRRTVLNGALGVAVGAALRPAAADTTRISAGVSLVTELGGNVLVLETSDGAVLVDTGEPTAVDQLLSSVMAATGSDRVHTAFNTHWHLEQIGGNELLGRAGANIVAHEKTRARLAVGYYLPAEDRYRPPVPLQAQPTQSFYTTGSTTIGGQRIEFGHLLEAHTDGDAYVYFRGPNVIAVGDAIAPHRDPELDWWGGGWLGGRVDSLKELLRLTNADTRFVPSYGPPVGRAEVQAEHDLCMLLYERFHDRIRKGESNADMLAAGIMENTGRKWNDPARFVHDAHKGFWAHYNTLSHDIV